MVSDYYKEIKKALKCPTLTDDVNPTSILEVFVDAMNRCSISASDRNWSMMISTLPYLVHFPDEKSRFVRPTFRLDKTSQKISFDILCQEILKTFPRPKSNPTKTIWRPLSKAIKPSKSSRNSKLPYPEMSASPTEECRSIAKLGKIVVVSSNPGTGKTEAMKKLAGFLKANDVQNVAMFAQSHGRYFSKKVELLKVAKDFDLDENKLKDCVFILDGLDQLLRNQQRRENAYSLIEQAAENFGMLVVTTRPQEKDKLQERFRNLEFSNLTINHMTLTEVDKFLCNRMAQKACDGLKANHFSPLELDILVSLWKRDRRPEMNSFSIYWNFVETLAIQAYVKKVYREAGVRLPSVVPQTDYSQRLIMENVKAAVNHLTERQIFDVDRELVTKMGIATYKENVLEFRYTSLADFLVCLALLNVNANLLSEEDFDSILTEPQFQDARRYLDLAHEIQFHNNLYSIQYFSDRKEHHLLYKKGTTDDETEIFWREIL
jgi:hypothetical protein